MVDDLQAVQEIGTKVQALSADGKFEEASAAVKDHAKSECNIDLDETTSPSSGS